MERSPPFRHSVLLKGDLVKVAVVDDGVMLSIHHGTENYKVQVSSDLMLEKDVRLLDGLHVRFQARKVPGNLWIATSKLERQT